MTGIDLLFPVIGLLIVGLVLLFLADRDYQERRRAERRADLNVWRAMGWRTR